MQKTWCSAATKAHPPSTGLRTLVWRCLSVTLECDWHKFHNHSWSCAGVAGFARLQIARAPARREWGWHHRARSNRHGYRATYQRTLHRGWNGRSSRFTRALSMSVFEVVFDCVRRKCQGGDLRDTIFLLLSERWLATLDGLRKISKHVRQW